MESLRDAFEQSGITILKETHTGFLNSLDFLDFIPESHPVKEAIGAWYETLDEKNREQFGGYLLVTVGRLPKDEAIDKDQEAQKEDTPSSFDAEYPEAPISPGHENMSSASLGLFPSGLVHSLKTLNKTQQLLEAYRSKDREHDHYLLSYRDAEASCWLPLLPVLDRLLKTNQEKSPSVLDIGAAYGTLLLYSALSGADAYGLDITDRYWTTQLENDYAIKWDKCNIEADELPWSKPFDVILLTDVLEQLNYNPVPTFRKFLTVMHEGGSLLLSTPWKRYYAPNHTAPDVMEMPLYTPGNAFIEGTVKFYSIDEIYTLAEAAHLSVQSIQVWNGRLLAWLLKL